MLEAGFRLLRFTAPDIFHAPAGVVAKVERALGLVASVDDFSGQLSASLG